MPDKMIEALTTLTKAIGDLGERVEKQIAGLTSRVDTVEDSYKALTDANVKMQEDVLKLAQIVPAGRTREELMGATRQAQTDREKAADAVAYMIACRGDAGRADPARLKALAITPGASGGFLLQPVVQAEIIEKARWKSVMLELADVQPPSPLTGVTHRQNATFTFSGTAELAQPTETTFAALLQQIGWALTKQGAFATVSNDLLKRSPIDLLDWLTKEAGRSLGEKADDWFINGTGRGMPRGLRMGENMTAYAMTGTFDWTVMVNIEHALDVPYRDGAVFILNDTVLKMLKLLQETTGKAIFHSNAQLQQVGMSVQYAGQKGVINLPAVSYPYYIAKASALPATGGTGGDESEVYFLDPRRTYRIWPDEGGREMSSDSSGANWRVGQTQIKFEVRYDGVVVQGEGISYGTGIK
jgi:HK97 family phage major capsid protein